MQASLLYYVSLSFFCGTQKKIFWKSFGNFWPSLYGQKKSLEHFLKYLLLFSAEDIKLGE